MNWIYIFSTYVPGGVSPYNKHLLIFNGYGNHVALQTMEEENKMGIDLLTSPTHTTHRL
jgi:hypothetical protein